MLPTRRSPYAVWLLSGTLGLMMLGEPSPVSAGDPPRGPGGSLRSLSAVGLQSLGRPTPKAPPSPLRQRLLEQWDKLGSRVASLRRPEQSLRRGAPSSSGALLKWANEYVLTAPRHWDLAACRKLHAKLGLEGDPDYLRLQMMLDRRTVAEQLATLGNPVRASAVGQAKGQAPAWDKYREALSYARLAAQGNDITALDSTKYWLTRADENHRLATGNPLPPSDVARVQSLFDSGRSGREAVSTGIANRSEKRGKPVAARSWREAAMRALRQRPAMSVDVDDQRGLSGVGVRSPRSPDE